MPIPDRTTFESAYAGRAPWDIGAPQPAFIAVADQITGSVLDAGCGTGDNALFLAGRGHQVTGIDFLAEPIKRAKQKAAERGLAARFLVMDALDLKELPEVFDTVIDSGLLHVAAALNTSSIGIFGPTDPWLWAPLNPLAAVAQLPQRLHCQPCHKPTCHVGHHRCMRDIPADRVLALVEAALANPAARSAPIMRPTAA